MINSITAIILTLNEEKHIERCIKSLDGIVERVCVIDSFSTDNTVELAKALGAEVLQTQWKGHAAQFQWGMDSVSVTSDWTLRIDADEYLDGNLRSVLQGDWAQKQINGYYLRRKIVFLGRPITHGFFYPLKIMRLWRTGQGRMEQRWMDEHIVLDDPCTATLEGGDLVDDNLNDLSWWVEKHNGYASLEVASRVEAQQGISTAVENLSGPAARERWLKEKVYTRQATARMLRDFFALSEVQYRLMKEAARPTYEKLFSVESAYSDLEVALETAVFSHQNGTPKSRNKL